MFECGTCGKEFPAGWRARENHCRSTGHSPPDYECDSCDRYFASEHARWQHMNAKGHHANQSDGYESSDEDTGSAYSEYPCSECNEWFESEEDYKAHQVEDHLYCRDCDRYFQNLNNIKQHLNSSVHRGSTIKCPFCPARYTTATGMTHHLENGSCPQAPMMNREQIYRIVRAKDPYNVLSRHSDTLAHSTQTTYTANSKTWNGRAYECYFCHREFRALPHLNQHLNSPAHQETLYHCPNRNCGSEFKTLAAIINHLESESCGLMRFEAVQRRVNDIVTGNRTIRF